MKLTCARFSREFTTSEPVTKAGSDLTFFVRHVRWPDNALGSILYLYERMNARRCKIGFLCKTLRVGVNRKIERGRLQLNLPSLSIHGSVKYPVKSHQTLTITVQCAMIAQLKPRLQIFLSWLQFYSEMRVNHTFRDVHQSGFHYYALRFN